ncbi:MAG: rod shape-determining protein MreC [Saprospirales bacterium]|nr:MAG: rod shape-determining protein MreC [Saprospirales bacterium]
MVDLIRFFLRNGALFLFILLQSICFWMLITFNQSHRAIFLHNKVLVTAGLQERIDNLFDYWDLYHISDSLAAENALLLEKIFESQQKEPADTLATIHGGKGAYSIVPAKVIYNRIGGRNNNMLINRGTNDGVDRGMGVIDGSTGLVGITRYCSANFCRLISLLHSQTMISARIQNRDYFGSVVWHSVNPTRMNLEAVPVHARFERGDTLVTSGYSTLFPPGVEIGIIEDFDVPPGSNFYNIQIRLINDISKAKYVYVINDLLAEEKKLHLMHLDDE